MTSRHVHNEHIAQAIECFYDHHGDRRYWTSDEEGWYALLIEHINKDDGIITDGEVSER